MVVEAIHTAMYIVLLRDHFCDRGNPGGAITTMYDVYNSISRKSYSLIIEHIAPSTHTSLRTPRREQAAAATTALRISIRRLFQ